MNRNDIKVSMLVSTYNWKEALELCLRSIFAQTVLPFEIVIADDGSREDTRSLIQRLRDESPVPLKHVWQKDKGFRKTKILNKAIVVMTGDYILQIDGDVILSPHFVSDHLDICESNCFVCGSRVKLSEQVSHRILSAKQIRLHWWNISFGYMANSSRSHCLRHLLADRYDRNIAHARGCNMAYWRDDLVRVNGFNEDFIEWGYEDSELAYRLHFSGVRKRTLKMGGVVYHLFHPEASRQNERSNFAELSHVKERLVAWCENGLDQYKKS